MEAEAEFAVQVGHDRYSLVASRSAIRGALDAVVEVLRETGRLMFLRGQVVQGEDDDHIVAAFSGLIRKAG